MGRLKDIGQPSLENFEEFAEFFALFVEFFSRIDLYTVEVAPAEVSANTTEEQTFTLTGIELNDFVIAIKPTHQAGLGLIQTRVSDVDEIKITYMNATNSGITPTTEDYRFLILRLGEE